ncbi:MAG: hypothetical protein KJN94_02995, partial [Gammaproteobacteria bacterium]|nr:hypothetical protein [Gammaproteobacteria bacterium]
MNKTAALRLLFLLLAMLPVASAAQTEPRRSLPAVAGEAGPVLDGDVLNDPVWQSVAPSGDFVQTAPDEGQPASQRTEVRVLYT